MNDDKLEDLITAQITAMNFWDNLIDDKVWNKVPFGKLAGDDEAEELYQRELDRLNRRYTKIKVFGLIFAFIYGIILFLWW